MWLSNFKILVLRVLLIFSAGCMLANMAAAGYPYWNQRLKTHPTPVGFNKYMVYIADGLYDPLTPHPNPKITNCEPILNMCDGEYFHKEIMGRSDAEIAALEQEAKDFFNTKFGLDVDDPANVGRLFFRNFLIDPRVNYHVVSASGESVPAEGWTLFWGGWIILVADPEGFDLGGEFAGSKVSFGAQFLFSENSIQATRRNKKKHRYYQRAKDRKPIVLKIQSFVPPSFNPNAVPAPFGVGDNAIPFQLKIFNEKYGEGLSRGRGEIFPRVDGLIKLNIVNVLTFPGLSDIQPAE